MVKLNAGVDDSAAAALFARFGATEVGRVDELSTRVVVSTSHAPTALSKHLRLELARSERGERWRRSRFNDP